MYMVNVRCCLVWWGDESKLVFEGGIFFSPADAIGKVFPISLSVVCVYVCVKVFGGGACSFFWVSQGTAIVSSSRATKTKFEEDCEERRQCSFACIGNAWEDTQVFCLPRQRTLFPSVFFPFFARENGCE